MMVMVMLVLAVMVMVEMIVIDNGDGDGGSGFGGYVIERIPEIPVPVSKAELGAIEGHRFPIGRRRVENPL